MLCLIFHLQVQTNGIISFNGDNWRHSFTPFDGSYRRPVVAPLACDVNTLTNHGRVYYRSTTDVPTLQQATSDVANGTDFVATFVFITTWLNVTHGRPDVSKLRENSVI